MMGDHGSELCEHMTLSLEEHVKTNTAHFCCEEFVSAKLGNRPKKCEDCREMPQRKGRMQPKGEGKLNEVWMCFHCGYLGCVRREMKKGHMFSHFRECKGAVAISDSGICCSLCQKYFRAPKEFAIRSHIDTIKGFVNLGQTCYFNVVLQAMCALAHVRDHLITWKGNGQVMSSFRELIQQATPSCTSETRDPINPLEFFKVLVGVASHKYAVNSEEDCHGLLLELIRAMDAEDHNFVDVNFQGQQCFTSECSSCNRNDVGVKEDENFYYIPIYFPEDKGSNQNSVLDHFLLPEASNCKMCNVPSSVKPNIIAAPSIIILHLQRFRLVEGEMTKSEDKGEMTKSEDEREMTKSEDKGEMTKSENEGKWTKSEDHLTFNPSLNLKDYMLPSLAPAGVKFEYQLRAVIEHRGKCIRSGHYVAYVQRENLWYCTSDSMVTRTSLEKVLESRAYLLFYERV